MIPSQRESSLQEALDGPVLLREERLIVVRYGIVLRHDASRVNWLRRDRNRDRAPMALSRVFSSRAAEFDRASYSATRAPYACSICPSILRREVSLLLVYICSKTRKESPLLVLARRMGPG